MRWTLELWELSSIVSSFQHRIQEAQYLCGKKLCLPQRRSPIRGGLLGLKLLQCPPELELMTVCSILVDGNGRRFSIRRQRRACVSACCLFLFPFYRSPCGLVWNTGVISLTCSAHDLSSPNRPLTSPQKNTEKKCLPFLLWISAIGNCFWSSPDI